MQGTHAVITSVISSPDHKATCTSLGYQLLHKENAVAILTYYLGIKLISLPSHVCHRCPVIGLQKTDREVFHFGCESFPSRGLVSAASFAGGPNVIVVDSKSTCDLHIGFNIAP